MPISCFWVPSTEGNPSTVVAGAQPRQARKETLKQERTVKPNLTAARAFTHDESLRGKRNRVSRFVLLGAAILVALAGIAAVLHVAVLFSTFDAKTGKIASAFPPESVRPSTSPATNGKSPINFLLVGSDSRGKKTQQAESGQASDQRSDTLMLVHIPADRQHVYVTSIMRDTWVSIPGHGTAKINAALAFGGVPLMVQTVESLLGQRIDHVVLVDFDGFKGLTDAVGGVDVEVPVPFTATTVENQGLRFSQGSTHMDGTTALAFVHERYAFRDGDYQRVRNQQIFLKALLDKVVKPSTLVNPAAVSDIVNKFSPYLTVDTDLTSGALVSFALEIKDVQPGDIVLFTLPNGGTSWSEDGQSIVLLDPTTTDHFADSMARGTMPQFISENHLRKGN
jgi:polyisoprenyl-teichoic acid--peptidoglycan teichoic acid transferase